MTFDVFSMIAFESAPGFDFREVNHGVNREVFVLNIPSPKGPSCPSHLFRSIRDVGHAATPLHRFRSRLCVHLGLCLVQELPALRCRGRLRTQRQRQRREGCKAGAVGEVGATPVAVFWRLSKGATATSQTQYECFVHGIPAWA